MDDEILVNLKISHLEIAISLLSEKINELQSHSSSTSFYDIENLKNTREHLKGELDKGKRYKNIDAKVKKILSDETPYDYTPEQIEDTMSLDEDLGLGKRTIIRLAIGKFTDILKEYKPDSKIKKLEAGKLETVKDCKALIIEKIEV